MPRRLSRGRHWERGRSRHRRGGGLFRLPDLPAVAIPFCPHPPYPPSPPGKGELKVISCKGLRPLHPRGLNPGGTGQVAFPVPGGGVSLASPAEPAAPASKGRRGGFGCLPTPPLACFSAPYPPTPFPSGEGGDQSYFMQGASPLASPKRLNPWFAAKPTGIGSLRVVPPCTCSGGVCKCRKRFSAGVPGAKPPAK